MGARNAISNWPRGRSTTTAWSNCKWEAIDELTFWPYHLSSEMLLDLAFDRIYHEEQKHMVDHWHQNYREGHFKQHIVFANLR